MARYSHQRKTLSNASQDARRVGETHVVNGEEQFVLMYAAKRSMFLKTILVYMYKKDTHDYQRALHIIMMNCNTIHIICKDPTLCTMYYLPDLQVAMDLSNGIARV